MDWQLLGEFQLIPQWQFTPLTDASFFRLIQTNRIKRNSGLIAQVSSSGDFFSIGNLSAANNAFLFSLSPPPIPNFNPRRLAVIAKSYELSDWTVKIEYLPVSQTEITVARASLSQLREALGLDPNSIDPFES